MLDSQLLIFIKCLENLHLNSDIKLSPKVSICEKDLEQLKLNILLDKVRKNSNNADRFRIHSGNRNNTELQRMESAHVATLTKL